MAAGYSTNPLVKKLGLKVGQVVLFVNQPDHYLDLLGQLPAVTEASKDHKDLDFVHLFIQSMDELEQHFNQLKERLDKKGSMWVSWPKKSSGIVTDVDGNSIRAYILANGLVDVKVCAIDETWSGLKLMFRVKDR